MIAGSAGDSFRTCLSALQMTVHGNNGEEVVQKSRAAEERSYLAPLGTHVARNRPLPAHHGVVNALVDVRDERALLYVLPFENMVRLTPMVARLMKVTTCRWT